jgi:hypothetical protein
VRLFSLRGISISIKIKKPIKTTLSGWRGREKKMRNTWFWNFGEEATGVIITSEKGYKVANSFNPYGGTSLILIDSDNHAFVHGDNQVVGCCELLGLTHARRKTMQFLALKKAGKRIEDKWGYDSLSWKGEGRILADQTHKRELAVPMEFDPLATPAE